MRKSEFLSKTVVTREMVEKAMARQRFRTARFKLCEKMGWVKDYWKFIGNRDVDAYGTPEKKEFYRKVTRFLAFNYAIHRCPDWLTSLACGRQTEKAHNPSSTRPNINIFKWKDKMSLNNCVFHSRLGNNPEITTLPSGKERTRFSIAVDRDYKDQEGNRPTDWIAVTMWGSANYARKTNLSKGDSVIVSGRMEQFTWTDEQGQKRTSIGLNCDRIYLTAKRRESEFAEAKNAKDKAAEQAAANYDPNAEDDLPF